MKAFTINQNDSGQRLDKFVQKAVRGIPVSLMYKYIRTKRIKVNGRRAHEKDMLQCGDVVEMYIPEEFFLPKSDGTAADLTREFARVKHIPTIV